MVLKAISHNFVSTQDTHLAERAGSWEIVVPSLRSSRFSEILDKRELLGIPFGSKRTGVSWNMIAWLFSATLRYKERPIWVMSSRRGAERCRDISTGSASRKTVTKRKNRSEVFVKGIRSQVNWQSSCNLRRIRFETSLIGGFLIRQASRSNQGFIRYFVLFS